MNNADIRPSDAETPLTEAYIPDRLQNGAEDI